MIGTGRSSVTIWKWVGLIMLSLAIAMFLRYGIIQPSFIGLQCSDKARPLWCYPREAIILVQVWNGWSFLAFLMLGLFILHQRILWLSLAFMCACFGVILYNTGISSLALLLALYFLGRKHHAIAK